MQPHHFITSNCHDGSFEVLWWGEDGWAPHRQINLQSTANTNIHILMKGTQTHTHTHTHTHIYTHLGVQSQSHAFCPSLSFSLSRSLSHSQTFLRVPNKLLFPLNPIIWTKGLGDCRELLWCNWQTQEWIMSSLILPWLERLCVCGWGCWRSMADTCLPPGTMDIVNWDNVHNHMVLIGENNFDIWGFSKHFYFTNWQSVSIEEKNRTNDGRVEWWIRW